MAAAKGNKKADVKLADLHFYFDGVERERIDSSGWSRRSGEVLVIRDRLLKLTGPAFEAAIKTMNNVIAEKPSGDGSADTSAKRQAAGKLFEQVQGSR